MLFVGGTVEEERRGRINKHERKAIERPGDRVLASATAVTALYCSMTEQPGLHVNGRARLSDP